MIRGCAPGSLPSLPPAEFLERNTTPVGRRTHRVESALAFATVLITEHAKPSFAIAAQSVRTKQSKPALISRFDRLLVRHSSPHHPVNLLHRLDLRLNNTHLKLTLNHLTDLSSTVPIFYDPVVLVVSPSARFLAGRASLSG